MDYSKIDLQPLSHYNDIPNYNTREMQKLHQLAKKGDVLAFDIDKNLYYTAIITLNQLGYNIDNVLQYILSQVSIRTDELSFTPQTRNTSKQTSWIKNLKPKLEKYGRKMDHILLSELLEMQTCYKLGYLKDILNAIFAQIILYKKVSLKIDQSKETQNKLVNSLDYETISDEPTPTTQSLLTIDDVNNMFIDKD